MNLLRLTGAIVSVETISGTSVKTGNAYSFRVCRVMVPERDFVEVTVNDRLGPLSSGDLVDWIVKVSATTSGRLRIEATEDVPAAVLNVG